MNPHPELPVTSLNVAFKSSSLRRAARPATLSTPFATDAAACLGNSRTPYNPSPQSWHGRLVLLEG